MNRKNPMCRCFKLLPLLGILLAACTSPSPPPSQVDEIIESNLAARGGKEKIQALQSLRATGRATASGGRIARVTQEIKRPGFYRLEFASQGTTAVFAHDGKVGWHVAPLQGIFEPEVIRPEHDSEAGIDERDIEGPLLGWREKGHTVELVGREALPDGEAFKLKVTLANGGVRHEYVDVESRMVVRSDKPEVIRGRTVQLEVLFSDFREVEGILFPHFVDTHVTDRPEHITIVVEKYELNPELDESRFLFPQ